MDFENFLCYLNARAESPVSFHEFNSVVETSPSLNGNLHGYYRGRFVDLTDVGFIGAD